MAAFYRPAAFFKGFLFPLVQNGCTLREAQIISSVLAKHKIPVLHSAAALLRLCEICAEQTSTISSEAAGAANIFIRVLLGKKYALPYKVVDALVFHFLRFRGTKEEEALGSKEAKLP
ncbi:MAG: Actin-like protein arp9 (SWI/SNF complex component arp9), partial [Watsoniomyces obsoletus]